MKARTKMNKYEEAYEVIGSIISKGLVIGKLEDLPKHFESFKEIVDRATPMKVKITGLVKFCPKCNKSVWQSDESNFCFRCGKALDWSKDESL